MPVITVLRLMDTVYVRACVCVCIRALTVLRLVGSVFVYVCVCIRALTVLGFVGSDPEFSRPSLRFVHSDEIPGLR